jgi:hypothetical protein
LFQGSASETGDRTAGPEGIITSRQCIEIGPIQLRLGVFQRLTTGADLLQLSEIVRYSGRVFERWKYTFKYRLTKARVEL